ncbi:MAG: peptidoglycan recognition protein family protein [Planctomycetia bacterium]|nr:peptidoglycan recognition protein family protein [Planctomycetia bacterium]
MASADSWDPPASSRDWQYVVLHHSATDEGDVASIDAADRKRRDQFGAAWPGIGYHFVIGNGQGMTDGRVEPTFRWQQQLHGAHANSQAHNRTGIGICVVGDCDASPPTPRQVAAAKRLLEWLSVRYGISPDHVVRHADIAATRCPGRKFPFEELREALPAPVGASSGRSHEELF